MQETWKGGAFHAAPGAALTVTGVESWNSHGRTTLRNRSGRQGVCSKVTSYLNWKECTRGATWRGVDDDAQKADFLKREEKRCE